MTTSTMAQQAQRAARRLAAASTERKQRALGAIIEALRSRRREILEANRNDMARSEREALPPPLLKRLRFDEKKLDGVIQGIQSLIGLPDPVGRTLRTTELDQNLTLYQVTCPIGVIGVIFESRPDALVQISTLCLKSGNAVLLKGGSEAADTNRTLATVIRSAGEDAGLPKGWLQLLETRAEVNEMLGLDQYIDLIVPRGSNEFVRYIMDHSDIPVLGHADGICHVYVDAAADPAMAARIAVDSKCQYVAVCNAAETLLVHEAVAPRFLPTAAAQFAEHNVALHGCPRTAEYIDVIPATDDDWKTEYLDTILAVKVVASLEDAIDHINTYGSGHTDTIVTADPDAAVAFMNTVDSGNVFWNCSTRFSDGFRYGLGAEVGISTTKIHARGPVGLDGLLTYKWKLLGTGQTVAPYADGTRSFTHTPRTDPFPL